MNNKEVFFLPKDDFTYDCLKRPMSSRKYIPEWYKKMPIAVNDLNGNKEDSTAKKCMPFMDSFSIGYIQELPCDIYIKNIGYDENSDTDIIQYQWSGDFRPMSTREEEHQSQKMLPKFDGYYNVEFHWNTFWEPETPPGYSTVYMHPLNRLDLPFTTLSGVIDTDSWSISGPLPFLIKKGFEGIIPAGTPIYQVLFIKRENWNSEVKKHDKSKYDKTFYNAKRFFTDGYKKMYWSRKEYN